MGFELQLAESALRVTYNQIWKRRNPGGAKFYEVYNKVPKARKHFEKLAEKLVRLEIDAKTYILVMSNYGKYSTSTYMPPTGWLVKNSTVEIYEKWLLKREMTKYGEDAKRMALGLSGDSEITFEEILYRLESDKESLESLAMHDEAYIHKKKHWNRIIPAILLPHFKGGLVSSWYVSLRKDFLESKYMEYVDREDKRELRQCKYFYNSNPEIKRKAKLFLRGENV